MTDHLMPPLRAITRDGDDDPGALRRLVQLDPCSAWRADLEDAGLPEPLPEALAERWLLWLQIGTVFDRLRLLPVSERAAYAHGTAGLWENAVRVTGAERFGRVAEVMAGWQGEAPELPGFRELLWAVEQVEADGLSRSAYCCLQALSVAVEASDVRGAYANAQSGRVLRTLGYVKQALVAFDGAAQAARRHGDRWLMARVKLGAGVAYHTRGNYPAARNEFRKALRHASPNVDLMIGAHLGIVSASCTEEKFRFALKHGKTALEYAVGDAHAEIEALSLLAELHVQTERFAEAQSFCLLALSKRPRAHKLPPLLRNIVYASLRSQDTPSVKLHFGDLVASLTATQNPWEHASCEFVIGHVYAAWGDVQNALSHYEKAYAIAERYRLNEILLQAESAIATQRTRRGTSVLKFTAESPQPRTWRQGETHSVPVGLAHLAV